MSSTQPPAHAPIPSLPATARGREHAGIISIWQRWRDSRYRTPAFHDLPAIPVAAKDILALDGPKAYHRTLLALIEKARRRIHLAALYVQDDDAGREILSALYAAKAREPALDIVVFVDWHRAQRGLIGKAKSAGNAARYQDMRARLGDGVRVYGVPVQSREVLGVFHLKGFVIDDVLLYSGASINEVYLGYHGRYRLDRYHVIQSAALADSFSSFLLDVIGAGEAVHPLDTPHVPKTKTLRSAIARFRRRLFAGHYIFSDEASVDQSVRITPLVGLGARHNDLNRTLLQLISHTRRKLLIFTPYFNLPGVLYRAISRKIKAGCEVTVVLGDKTANDFYIPPEEDFKTIGALPYLYEANLRRFCEAHQKAISAGHLHVRLWRHADNTFHLKGILVDDDIALLTGNNLNPRAWRLDLENALLIHDPEKRLYPQHQAEFERIIEHTVRLDHYTQLETIDAYPDAAQRFLKRIARVRVDRLINQIL